MGKILSSNSLRLKIINAIYSAKKGHLGGALSCIDFLAYLYKNKIVEPHPGGGISQVDRPLVLSKAHSATALLAIMEEYFPENAVALKSYNQAGSLIGNNPSELVFGIEYHGGSLGHGISFAAGMALGKKLKEDCNGVVVVVSDGELHEGSCWEGLLFITQHQLNVCLLVDKNNQICENFTDDAITLGSLKDKFEAFGLETTSMNGHEYSGFHKIDEFILEKNHPRAIIFDTVKGKGISFMEKEIRFHHSIPNEHEYEEALNELRMEDK